MLEQHSNIYHMLQYSDHHIFTIDDLNDIKNKFEEMASTDKLILTTEKDAVRLQKFSAEIAGMPFYAIPVSHKFLFNEAAAFEMQVTGFISNFAKKQ